MWTGPWKISQEMKHFGLAPLVTVNIKRNRGKLKNYIYWWEWRAFEFSQFYAIYKDYMFVPPCRRPPGSIVLRQVWTYDIQHYGKRNSKNTCDGYPITRKVFQYAKNYAASASQQGFNIFLPCLHIWYIQSWNLML